jgi:hypothetical protein
MSKDLFIAEYERLLGDAIDAGMSEQAAERFAEDHAYGAMRDRLADMADHQRKISRGA